MLLVSAGAVTRMLRTGPARQAPAARTIAKAPLAPAVTPSAPSAPLAAVATAPPSPVTEAPKPVAVPAREPATVEPRVTPAPVIRAFNGTALSRPAAPTAPADLAAAPAVGGASANWVEPLPATVTPSLRAPAPPPRETPAVSKPVPAPRIGGELQQVKPISLPPPAMPLLAKERGIGGTVNLEATVDKQGAVTNVKVINGNSLLVPAAVDGVKKWRYQPATLNGQPIEAEVKIEVRFTAGRQ